MFERIYAKFVMQHWLMAQVFSSLSGNKKTLVTQVVALSTGSCWAIFSTYFRYSYADEKFQHEQGILSARELTHGIVPVQSMYSIYNLIYMY
jgi:hypothetical protein